MTVDEMWNVAKKFYELAYGVEFNKRPIDQRVIWLYQEMQRMQMTMDKYYTEGIASLKKKQV